MDVILLLQSACFCFTVRNGAESHRLRYHVRDLARLYGPVVIRTKHGTEVGREVGVGCSRRDVVCSYEESVTAYYLLHASSRTSTHNLSYRTNRT